MPSIPNCDDGDYSAILETEGRTTEYPFINAQIKDVATKVYRMALECDRLAYVPLAALSVHPDDAAAYIVEEVPPSSMGGDVVTVRRAYANAPVDQVAVDRRLVSRPNLDGRNSGGVYAFTIDSGDTTHLAFARLAVTAVSSIAAATTTAVLPSTNIVFTDSGSNVVNVPANSNKAAAEAILAGLTALSGISVLIANSVFSLVWVGTMASIVAPAGTQVVGLTTYSAGIQSLGVKTTPAVTQFTTGVVANGAAVGDYVAIWAGINLVGFGTVVALTDAYSFTVMTTDLKSANTLITHCQFAKNCLRLVNGTKDCRLRLTDKFYLPNVTTGISSGADIPASPIYTDPIAWFAAVLARTISGATATAATDKISSTAHGLSNGDTFFILSIGSGAAGLAILTQYWARVVDANNFYACAAAANVIPSAVVDITTDGTGLTILIPQPYAAVAVSQVTSWMGPILQRRTEEVMLADALETRPPTA